MKKNRTTYMSEVAMRLVRLNVLSLMIILILAGSAQAQNTCDIIEANRSTTDRVRVPTTFGKPGDTAWIPIELSNDSIVTAFQFLIKFDTARLTPVMLDETYLMHRVISPRFLKLDTLLNSIGLDSIVDITQFRAVHFVEFLEVKPNIIAVNFLPTDLDPNDPSKARIDSIKPGADRIAEIAFIVDPAMPHNEQIDFSFYTYEVMAWIDSTTFPPDTLWANACATAQMTTIGRDLAGEETQFQIYPEINYIGQKFIADTAYVPTEAPVITFFSASPATVSAGSSSTLSWSVANTDSVVVWFGASRLFGSPVATSYQVTPPSSDGNYTYTLVAWGSNDQSVSANAFVTVGTVTGTPPIMSLTPNQTSYTINQGETVSFTITATADPANPSEQVTLTSGVLSNNMTFGPSSPVSGAGSVTGNFSFTPDFNQYGTFAITFSAVDADQVPATSTVTFTVNEILYDRLFSTSAEGQNPVGGLPGAEGVLFPVNLITSQTVYGIQFDLIYPYDLITVDSFISTDRIPEWVVYDNVGQTPGQIRIVTFGLANEPVLLDTTSAIIYAALTIDSAGVPWTDEKIILENGRESVNPDPAVSSLPLVTDSGIVEIDKYGDVNLDRWIDVGDAVNIVAYIIGNFGLSPRQFATADLVINSVVNVFDLIGVVNAIYGIPVSSSSGSPVNVDPVTVNMAFNSLAPGGSDILTVTSDLPEEVAGVQLEIAYDPAAVSLGRPTLTEDNDRFSLSYNDNGAGNMKIVMYHLSPSKTDELLQIGVVKMVDIPILALDEIEAGDKSKIRLTDVLLATSSAEMISVKGIDDALPTSFTLRQNYPNPFNPTTTIEFTVGTATGGLGLQEVKLEVFNVLGQKVVTLADRAYEPGTHQIEWDATNAQGGRVATGVYLYRLVIGNSHQTKKMVFLK